MQLEYFQMIDQVEKVSDLQDEIICICQLPQESPVFEGHFPQFPLLPGVLLIETMAQASGYLACLRTGFMKMSFLASVDRAKFRDFVRPAQLLRVQSTLLRQGSGYSAYSATVESLGTKVAECEIRLRSLDFPSPELRQLMLDRLSKAGLHHEGEACAV